jgi:hypothetical protein
MRNSKTPQKPENENKTSQPENLKNISKIRPKKYIYRIQVVTSLY